MARLLTTGFETQRINTTALTTAEGEGIFYTGAPVIDTTNPRTPGTACLSCAGVSRYMHAALTGAQGTTYHIRFYMRRTANPATGYALPVALKTAGNDLFFIRHGEGGDALFRMYNGSSTLQATASSGFPSDSSWHKVEIRIVPQTSGSTPFTCWIDDAVVIDGSYTLEFNGFNAIRIGQDSSSNPTTFGLFDDVAVNDSNGTTPQTGRCGDGRIYIMKPTVLGAAGRGNWTTGAAGTTNLHDAIDNTPPVGVAVASDTATSQITNGNATVPSTASFDLQTYNAVINPTAYISVAYGIWRVGTSSTTGTNAGTGQVFENPVISNQSLNYEASTATAGTDPAGWISQRSIYSYNPAVTRSAVPKMNIVKSTSSTRENCCDLMGLMVETTDPGPVFPIMAPVGG